MNDYIELKIKESSDRFMADVWPVVRASLGGGEARPVEGQPGEMNKLLDTLSGIDAWQTLPFKKGNRGLGCRCQNTGTRFKTFTIRTKLKNGGVTEYEKRFNSIHDSWKTVFPPITIHAYFDGEHGPLVLVAWMDTEDLIDAVRAHEWPEQLVEGGNTMKYLEWSKLKELGYDVTVIEVINGRA